VCEELVQDRVQVVGDQMPMEELQRVQSMCNHDQHNPRSNICPEVQELVYEELVLDRVQDVGY